ncbi:MAG: hypothetical protein JXO49_09715 [Deltaproteobacteria bacterium]|nr:hypothetical protein [Candidatus Anaeroferrophillus wilburensis]MBN2889609.1 hypothetical protein [Deltaproteobacteria bacterium]
MSRWFLQAGKIIERKQALLGRVEELYRQMETTMAEVNPLKLCGLLYEGNKVIAELGAVLADERHCLAACSKETGKKIDSIKSLLSCFPGCQQQALQEKCRNVDHLAGEVQISRQMLDESLVRLTMLNKRYADFFQQVLPVNLGYRQGGTMNNAPAALRGNAFNRQV